MNRLTLCLVLAIAACGSKAKPADPSTPPTGAAATAVAWADLDASAREAYMKEKVMPQMKEIFVAFDAEEFGEMNCKTCHGPGAEDESFEMTCSMLIRPKRWRKSPKRYCRLSRPLSQS